jgi:hypothetical protein
MQFFWGMFLADLSNYTPFQNWANSCRWTRRILCPLLIISGLYIASFPEHWSEWTSWSHALKNLAIYILPEGHDIPRFYTGFGLEIITFSIVLSPSLKDFFSNRYFLWLGKISWGIYLIHGALIRWVLAWCLYGVTLPVPTQDDEGKWHAGPNLEMKGYLVQVFWIPVWFVLLYCLGNLWQNHIDPMCARWTVAIERYVFMDNDKSRPKSPLPS